MRAPFLTSCPFLIPPRNHVYRKQPEILRTYKPLTETSKRFNIRAPLLGAPNVRAFNILKRLRATQFLMSL